MPKPAELQLLLPSKHRLMQQQQQQFFTAGNFTRKENAHHFSPLSVNHFDEKNGSYYYIPRYTFYFVINKMVFENQITHL